MRTAVPLVVGLFIVLACSSLRPVAINAGDVCESCKRAIVNPKVAAEIVEPNGLALKFRTVSCMARFTAQRTTAGSGVFVTDFNTGKFVSASSAVFVKATIDENTNERDYLAFRDVPAAVEYGRTHGSSPVDWASVLKQTAAAN
jgi:hypothetical protein